MEDTRLSDPPQGAELCLTTVTPVYRGEAYLERLVEALARLRSRLAGSSAPIVLLESIFVDDGSADNSSRVLESLQRQHPWVRVVTLSKNFGQHPATICGILHSSGDWIATLDEDLQHDPLHVLHLMAYAVERGLDIVYARPTGKVHGVAYRDVSSRLFKRMMSSISGNPHVALFNSFRLIRGSVGRAAAAVVGHKTYLDVALGWFTDRIDGLGIPMKDPRPSGGYRFRSLLSHAWRLLSSSEIKVLRSGAAVGFAALLGTVLASILLLVYKALAPDAPWVRGWTSLALGMLFFGGLTSFLIGIVLEYVTIILLQVHGKPTFFVVDRSSDAALAPLVTEVRATVESVEATSAGGVCP